MASIALGTCNDCKNHIVYLTWREGRRKVVVACPKCKEEIAFDLLKMEEILGPLDLEVPLGVHIHPGSDRVH